LTNNGITQFTSGSGKTAKDQDSLFIVASGDKFLGHEIHAVVE
jgi:hypothetical protein